MSSGQASAAASGEIGFEALRSRAAISPLADRSLLVVRGEDRTSFLQGMLSNEVAALEPGAGTPALLLTQQGRIVADLRVYVFPESVWLDVPAAARADVRAALERFIVADDVELDDGAEEAIAVRGPGAVQLLRDLGAEQVGRLACEAHCAAKIGGVEFRIARADDLGLVGFHLWSNPPGCEVLSAKARAAGAVGVDASVLEVQRVVAGVGRLGADFGSETLAPEVPSLERSISYRKGCYLGQEVVERVASRGHVNWKIVVLRSVDRLDVGDTVMGPEGEAGRVTSAVRRPDDGSRWALARVRAALSAPGTSVSVRGGGGMSKATVVEPEDRTS